MKREKKSRMKKNLKDLCNHAIKQATGRDPPTPALGGVCQPSFPDYFEEVHRELHLLPEDQALTSPGYVQLSYAKKVWTGKLNVLRIDTLLKHFIFG